MKDTDSFYILATVDGTTSGDQADRSVRVALIALDGGNRWSDPITINFLDDDGYSRNILVLTDYEFSQVAADFEDDDYAFEMVSPETAFKIMAENWSA